MTDLTGRTALAIACVALIGVAHAQDGRHHPPHDLPAHHSFYYHLTRPDVPNAPKGSCCGDGDCYSTPARMSDNGQWLALRREDKSWIPIPPERVVTRQDELLRRPDHQATLCATMAFTYCFVPPQAGI